MSQKTHLVDSRHAIDSCTFHLHTWRPFHHHLPTTTSTPPLDSDSSKPNWARPKRPCLSDRTTTSSSFPIESLDLSKLTLFDEDTTTTRPKKSTHKLRGILPWMARKRRRPGSRSVSGRSSDRSGTRRRCCSIGASGAYATCSDFPMAAGGTDSSGELFLNGEPNWASDVSERNSRRERESGVGGGERENLASVVGYGQFGNFDSQGNESGYGSEPGYRGDAEFGYGDEVDEEEEDPRLLFWGEKFGGTVSNTEMVGENTLQKAHHRCRRKKHDFRMVDPLR